MFRTHRTVYLLGLTLLVTSPACSGENSEAGSAADPADPSEGAGPGAPSGAGEGDPASLGCGGVEGLLPPKLRRLSERQIQNSLTDIFGDVFEAGAWPSLEDGARLIGMNSMADKLQINGLNFSRLYDASRGITKTLLREHSEIRDCAASDSDSCVSELTETFGLRLWRRPLSPEEQAQFSAAALEFDDNGTQLEFVLNSLLLSSEFLFRSEIGAAGGPARALSNHELVSFMSYAVWNSTPDPALLELAASPQPLEAEAFGAEMARMLKEPRATSALVEIYKDYLKLDLVLERDKDASFSFSPRVRSGILRSSERMLAEALSPQADTMGVFGGTGFYVNAETAPFFGMESSSRELELFQVGQNERDGVLNHPAFLAVHSTLNASGIVKRGVFTLEQLLCTELPDPPADISALEPPDDLDPETTSERELLLATHSSQPACNGCHQFIDPAGFGFENFDAVGRYRTTEKGGVPIDASGELEDVGAYTSGAEFSRALVASAPMKDCVSRRFLEHFMGQELSDQSCEFQTYRDLVNQGEGDIRGLFTALAQLPSVVARQNVEETP